jgi:hypothetical protein
MKVLDHFYFSDFTDNSEPHMSTCLDVLFLNNANNVTATRPESLTEYRNTCSDIHSSLKIVNMRELR